MIDISRVGRHRLMNGSVEVSVHNELKEAYARASRLPDGTYTIITADERVVVSGTAVQPPVDPPPVDPPIDPPPPPPPPVEPPVTPPVIAPNAELLTPLLKFAETWARNWNFEGHVVTAQFDGNYGNWDYANSVSEPWLFDRCTAGYRLFQMTGDTRWRDKFLSDLAWYEDHIDAQGIFTPKGFDDTKYSYVTPFLLAGRPVSDPVVQRIAAAWKREWPDNFNRSTVFWTEREMAFSLEAAVGVGDTARIAALLNHWDAACIDGVPQVTYTQHEGGGPGGTTPTSLTNSPWMSALYFQAARRVGGSQVDQQVSRYFDWLDVNGLYDGSLAHVEFTGVTFPRYLTGELIGDAGYDEGNMDHALDVAGLVKFAIDAKTRLGLPTARATQRLAELKASSLRSFTNWTRTTTYLPKYRLSPPRKFNWWVRGLYELSI